MIGKAKILIFCTIFVGSSAFCQNSAPEKPVNKVVIFVSNPLPSVILPQYNVWGNASGPRLSISPDFYSKNLGFFCKQEIKFEKATKIPFKFRLGSVQQCDRLEGKAISLFNRQ